MLRGWRLASFCAVVLVVIVYFYAGVYFGFSSFHSFGRSWINPSTQKEIIELCDRVQCDPETQKTVDLMKNDYYKKEWFYNAFPWLYSN